MDVIRKEIIQREYANVICVIRYNSAYVQTSVFFQNVENESQTPIKFQLPDCLCDELWDNFREMNLQKLIPCL
jgi:hypothetical protein